VIITDHGVKYRKWIYRLLNQLSDTHSS
jgi:hypothetical protein